MTDLSIFDYESRAEQGFTVDIIDRSNGKPSGLKIDVVGKDSQTFERAQAKFLRAMKDVKDDDRDGALKASCQLLADCTRGWSGWENITGDGIPDSFTEKAALEVYCKFKGIREQVDGAISNRSRLFQNTKEG